MARAAVIALVALAIMGSVAAMEGGSSSSSGAGGEGGGWRGQWNSSPSWGWRGGDEWQDWRGDAGWEHSEGWRESWGSTAADPSQTGRPPSGDGKRKGHDADDAASPLSCLTSLLASIAPA